MSRRGAGKRKQRLVADRTTRAEAGYVVVDNTRTFITEGVFIETMIDPESRGGLVRLDLDGRWSQRVERLPDEPVLVMAAEQAREIGLALLEASVAAVGDAEKWAARQSTLDVPCETSTRRRGSASAPAQPVSIAPSAPTEIPQAAISPRLHIPPRPTPIGSCPRCGAFDVHYVVKDTTAVACCSPGCSWCGFDEEILGPVQHGDL